MTRLRCPLDQLLAVDEVGIQCELKDVGERLAVAGEREPCLVVGVELDGSNVVDGGVEAFDAVGPLNRSGGLRPPEKRLRKLANQIPSAIVEEPLDTVRAHVWVTPYYEEDLDALVDLIGVERVLFGSDWPHGEGLADPQSFVHELKGFDDHAVKRVMRDNARELLGL